MPRIYTSADQLIDGTPLLDDAKRSNKPLHSSCAFDYGDWL